MKRFLRQLAWFCGLQLAVALVFWSQVSDEADYLGATNRKHALLADRSTPRLILVGGSNLAYGLDSALLAERLGYRPVNMGLHAALGIEFMCREVLEELARGDIVVLSPEYPCYGQRPDPVTQFHLLEQRPASARYLRDWSWQSTREMLDQWALPYVGALARRGVRGIRTRVRLLRGGEHAAPQFNEYGDFIAHWGQAMQPSAASALFMAGYDNARLDEIIEFLNGFEAECRSRGVRVYYSFCPVPDTLLAEQRQTVREIEERLRRDLEIPIIDSPEQVSFTLDQFYDTPYHLNWQGRSKRSEILARNLSRHTALLADTPRLRR